MGRKKRKAARAVDRVEEADLKVTRAVARHRRDPLVRAAGKASEIGDQPPLRALCGAVLLLGLWRRDPRMIEAAGRMIASHTLATAVKDLIKQRIERTRPDRALDDGYRMEPGDDRAHSVSSFPSGHTAGAVAVARAAGHAYPALATPANMAASAVAIIQIPRCKHFVSDILAGALIGWAAERAVTTLMARAARSGATAKGKRK